MSNQCEHGIMPAGECDECIDGAIATMVGPDVYAQGRADERAAIVAWLKVLPFHPMLTVEDVIESIERGAHEKKP